MIIDIITIFPNMFKPVLGESIIKRAQNKGLVKINIYDLRDYSGNIHKKIDSPAFGGGPGMVLRPEPVFKAIESILGESLYPHKKKNSKKNIVFFTPQGKILVQKDIKRFLKYQRLVLLAARYEGIDERIRKYAIDEEVSIGDYVLSGGELPAMVFVDALVRIIPGVVSSRESVLRESFENNLLDYPHYTKPREFRGLKVPDVLLSGDHKKIKEWRKIRAYEITKLKRPDLIEKKRKQT
ncbi:MAG: tRNA (guanosine(37)-N1)-methyltransferase TrmD [Candidatus Omnitrophica bacterium 4484_171]|nr:MAG: tRNA (guanosine(37)-N1)-methyltransferase TrmD [Candidatus Omnitrophica bacterium 4484_171]